MSVLFRQLSKGNLYIGRSGGRSREADLEEDASAQILSANNECRVCNAVSLKQDLIIVMTMAHKYDG